MARERVAVLHCPATASDDAVRDAVFRAADLVGEGVRRGLSGRRRILIDNPAALYGFRQG